MIKEDKVEKAIKLLRAFQKGCGCKEIELSYSGGKDSDVILALAKMSGIKFRAIYKNTTIDPPYTIQHCKENVVEIVQPKRSFLKIVEAKGIPSRFARFCCDELKEYKILDNAIQGIRKSESNARNERYNSQDPIICRNYNKDDHINVCLPILDWTDDDIKGFIETYKIKCHPLYYDENGFFHVERRLGCIGCPLVYYKKRIEEYKKYPNLVKQICKAADKWLKKDRDKPIKSADKFKDGYELFYYTLLCDSYNDFLSKKNTLFNDFDAKKELYDMFSIKE